MTGERCIIYFPDSGELVLDDNGKQQVVIKNNQPADFNALLATAATELDARDPEKTYSLGDAYKYLVEMGIIALFRS